MSRSTPAAPHDPRARDAGTVLAERSSVPFGWSARAAATDRFGLPAAWWLALAVLALNDHVLKGSGLLPGVLTGKLSDFAGLIVAPLLLCALLGVRTDRARALAFAAVIAPFVAIKTSEPAALAAAAF